MNEKPFVFVSYAHKDSETVIPCIEAMRKNGINLWYDNGIQAGSEWPEFVAKKVNDCRNFILFISPAYLDSQNCKRELNFAISKRKEILSVFIDKIELSLGMEMQLGTYQAIFKNKFATDAEFYSSLCSEMWFDPCRIEAEEEKDPPAEKNDKQPPAVTEEKIPEVKKESEVKKEPKKKSSPVIMKIDDVFSISGGRNVLCGKIENDSLSVGEKVDVYSESGVILESDITVMGVECFHKIIQKAEPGENVGILLPLASPKDVKRNCYIVKAKADMNKNKSEPSPKADTNEEFKLSVIDLKSFDKDRSFLYGQVVSGSIALNDRVDIFDENGALIEGSLTVSLLSNPNKAKSHRPGDNIGLVLKLKYPKQVHRDAFVMKAGVHKPKPSNRHLYMLKGLCAHCGGSFSGLFTKKCSSCGKPKDY